MTRPGTLGELKASGWVSRPVKEEVRANAIARIGEGRPLVDGVIGYEDTVLPQLENALIAGHDVIFLGERGQAKTRMIRSLTALLDEWMPIVAGSEINDDPYAPDLPARARAGRRARRRDARSSGCTASAASARSWPLPTRRSPTSSARSTPSRSPRVATSPTSSPSTTASCRAPTGRSSRSTSSPTSPSASRSGLLNVLEERDVQIRGYKIRLPIDVMLLASANPEDYTNRGRIITPLKDRFGAQIRTHYPLDAELEAAVVEQEARPLTADGLNVQVPGFMTEIVAEMSQQARRSPHINQRSGVSVRLSIANYETLVANATRRSLRHGETRGGAAGQRPRRAGREHRRQGRVRDRRRRARGAGARPHREGVDPRDVPGPHPAGEAHRRRHRVRERAGGAHRRGHRVVGVRQAAHRRARRCARRSPTSRWARPRPGVASAIEFVLEGLHLSKRLNKDAMGGRAAYRGRGGFTHRSRAQIRGASRPCSA